MHFCCIVSGMEVRLVDDACTNRRSEAFSVYPIGGIRNIPPAVLQLVLVAAPAAIVANSRHLAGR
jgi:hypothetical protein